MIESIATTLAVKFLLWKPVLYFLVSLWAGIVTSFVLFLVYASWHQAKVAGRPIPLFSKVLLGPLMPVAGLIDVIFLNYFMGTILFLQFPKPNEKTFAAYTFTRRLQQLKGGYTWRGVQARFWARQLNWADPGHV